MTQSLSCTCILIQIPCSEWLESNHYNSQNRYANIQVFHTSDHLPSLKLTYPSRKLMVGSWKMKLLLNWSLSRANCSFQGAGRVPKGNIIFSSRPFPPDHLHASAVRWTWIFDHVSGTILGPQNGWVYNGKPYQNGWFGGTPIFGNIHLHKKMNCKKTRHQYV